MPYQDRRTHEFIRYIKNRAKWANKSRFEDSEPEVDRLNAADINGFALVDDYDSHFVFLVSRKTVIYAFYNKFGDYSICTLIKQKGKIIIS